MPKPVPQLDRRRTEQFVGRGAAGPAALVFGAVGFVVLVALVRTGSQFLVVDRHIAAGLNGVISGSPTLVAMLHAITALGSAPANWLVMTTLTVTLLIRGQQRLACYVGVTGLGAAILSPSVKQLVGRLRPMVETPIASEPGHSFPSGHALGSMVASGVLLLVFLPVLPHRTRCPVIAAAAALVTVIGFTRLALGVHFLSDVLAGWLLGLGWLTVTTVAFRAWRRSTGLPPSSATQGLAPESAPALIPAPATAELMPVFPWRRVAALLVGWVLLLGVLVAVGWLITRGPSGTAVDRIDTSAVQWLAQHRDPHRIRLAQLAGSLGDTAALTALTMIAATLALATTRRWRPVLFLVVVMVGQSALFLTTASIINRPGPPMDHRGSVLPPLSSFPAGQPAAVIAGYGGIAMLALTGLPRWWRWLVPAAAVFAIALFALADLYHGRHYPSDVLGGVLLAVSWLGTTWYLLRPGPGPGSVRGAGDE